MVLSKLRLTFKKSVLLFFLLLLLVGFSIPQNLTIPVQRATKADYNAKSFWYYPWGKSITHKGVDIFAKKGTKVLSATKGIVVFNGNLKLGGKVVIVLGPKWRMHYYAHLETANAALFSYVENSQGIGTVGDTGNAKGKAAHLHYSIVSIFPYVWRWDRQKQGWKKMFYLNPISFFENK